MSLTPSEKRTAKKYDVALVTQNGNPRTPDTVRRMTAKRKKSFALAKQMGGSGNDLAKYSHKLNQANFPTNFKGREFVDESGQLKLRVDNWYYIHVDASNFTGSCTVHELVGFFPCWPPGVMELLPDEIKAEWDWFVKNSRICDNLDTRQTFQSGNIHAKVINSTVQFDDSSTRRFNFTLKMAYLKDCLKNKWYPVQLSGVKKFGEKWKDVSGQIIEDFDKIEILKEVLDTFPNDIAEDIRKRIG